MVLAHTWSPPLRLPSSHRSLPLSLRPGHSPAPSPLSSTCVFRNAACLSSLSASPHQRHPFWKLTPLCAPPAPPPAPPPALTAPLQLAQASVGLGTKQGTTKRSGSRAVNSRQCVLLVLEFSEGGPVFRTCPHPQKSHSPTAPRELSCGAGVPAVLPEAPPGGVASAGASQKRPGCVHRFLSSPLPMVASEWTTCCSV